MRLLAIFASLALLASLSSYAIAEEAPAGANTQQQVLSEGELDALVAPIALYPDALLAQALMASTYPLEMPRRMPALMPGRLPPLWAF